MSITDLLEQTCNLYAPTMGTDGLSSYGAAESENVPCYFERKITEVDTGGGQVELSDGMIVFNSDATGDFGYKVTIANKNYRVIKWDSFPLHGTNHHYEVFVKEISED